MKTTFEVRTHKLSAIAPLSQAHTLHTMANRNPWLEDHKHRHTSDFYDFGKSYQQAVRSVGSIAMDRLNNGYILSAREVAETDGKGRALSHFKNVGFARIWRDITYDRTMGIGIWENGTAASYWLDAQVDERTGQDPQNAALHQSIGKALIERASAYVPEGLLGQHIACFC